MTGEAVFVEVHVDPCAASEEGVHLRFKAAGPKQPVCAIPYESEAGLDGTWRVTAVDEDDAASLAPAFAVVVEDSSDGAAWLIVGGTGGLLLEHAATGERVREPYLVLSRSTTLT